MNKKGQVLVLFVIMLPLIVFIISMIIGKVYLYGEKKSQQDLANSACTYYKKGKDISEIKDIILENDKDQVIKITDNNNKIKIILVKYIDNLLNKKNKVKTELICE